MSLLISIGTIPLPLEKWESTTVNLMSRTRVLEGIITSFGPPCVSESIVHYAVPCQEGEYGL